MSKHVLLALLSFMIALPALGNEESPEALRAQASALRGEADATFAATEAACQQRVLVNACITDARDARLAMIKAARALEIRASRLELAARQAEAASRNAAAGAGAPDVPAPQQIPEPAPDTNAAAIRAAREEAARAAEARASAARKARDAEMARARAEREASAARRAEDAARDRERYEIRIRERDAERAGTGAGAARAR